MRKQALFSAIILVVLPILGIPNEWKTYAYVIIGLAIIIRFIFENRFWFENLLGQKPNISVESKQNSEVSG